MKKTLIVGVALALAPIFALAADDTKKSGASTSPSASSQNDQFHALDKNKDGYLSQDELKAGGQGMPSFSTLDKDGDGKISAQEWADHQKGAAGPSGPTGAAGTPGTSSSSSTPSTSSPSSSAPSSSMPSSSSDSTKK